MARAVPVGVPTPRAATTSVAINGIGPASLPGMIIIPVTTSHGTTRTFRQQCVAIMGGGLFLAGFNFTSSAGLGTETVRAGSFSDRRQQFPRHDRRHEARAFFFGRIPVSMRCYPSPGIITPKPAHSRRENGCSVFRIVGPSPHDQLIVIAFQNTSASYPTPDKSLHRQY